LTDNSCLFPYVLFSTLNPGTVALVVIPASCSGRHGPFSAIPQTTPKVFSPPAAAVYFLQIFYVPILPCGFARRVPSVYRLAALQRFSQTNLPLKRPGKLSPPPAASFSPVSDWSTFQIFGSLLGAFTWGRKSSSFFFFNI